MKSKKLKAPVTLHTTSYVTSYVHVKLHIHANETFSITHTLHLLIFSPCKVQDLLTKNKRRKYI